MGGGVEAEEEAAWGEGGATGEGGEAVATDPSETFFGMGGGIAPTDFRAAGGGGSLNPAA